MVPMQASKIVFDVGSDLGKCPKIVVDFSGFSTVFSIAKVVCVLCPLEVF